MRGWVRRQRRVGDRAGPIGERKQALAALPARRAHPPVLGAAVRSGRVPTEQHTQTPLAEHATWRGRRPHSSQLSELAVVPDELVLARLLVSTDRAHPALAQTDRADIHRPTAPSKPAFRIPSRTTQRSAVQLEQCRAPSALSHVPLLPRGRRVSFCSWRAPRH